MSKFHQQRSRESDRLPEIRQASSVAANLLRWAAPLALVALTAFKASGQSFPAAVNNLDLYFGGGYTSASSDYAQDHIHGLSVVGGFSLRHHIEEESQFTRLTDPKSALTETSVTTGVRFSWKFHPVTTFVKGGAGIGFVSNPSASLAALCAGGGLDLTMRPSVHLRADYEYQSWPGEYGFQHGLVAKMVTIGLVYHPHPFDRPRVY